MQILVVGASGATGRLLVQDLLTQGHSVRVVVRDASRLPAAIRGHHRLSVTEASLLALSDAQLAELTEGCAAIASCLGHNLTLRGLFGRPRRLVTDAIRRLCAAAAAHRPALPVRLVLMNTAANRNPDAGEATGFGERLLTGLMRLLLPPHADNEQAAQYLRSTIGDRHEHLAWVAVRPDSLFDEPAVSRYSVHPSPTRSALFDPGRTSRRNVAHFMAQLIADDALWQTWQGQMPVIYNTAADTGK